MPKTDQSDSGGKTQRAVPVELSNCPVDFSFRKMKNFKEPVTGRPRTMRTGRAVPHTPYGKFLSTSIWLNNNSIESLKNITKFVNTLFEYPDRIEWFDFSFNNIEEIHEELLSFPNLSILYLHGNCINDFEEIAKLQVLKKLKTLTLHGCPIEIQPFYRQHVVYLLPQLRNLDFSTITPREAKQPAPPGVKVNK